MNNYEKIRYFHKAFGIQDNDTPTIVSNDTTRLRMSLILEETTEVLDELMQMEKMDLTKVAKELADLLVVTYGAASTYGIPMDEVFEEVCRSNLSKLDDDGKPVRRADGKVLKGPNYSEADIASVFDKNRVQMSIDKQHISWDGDSKTHTPIEWPEWSDEF